MTILRRFKIERKEQTLSIDGGRRMRHPHNFRRKIIFWTASGFVDPLFTFRAVPSFVLYQYTIGSIFNMRHQGASEAPADVEPSGDEEQEDPGAEPELNTIDMDLSSPAHYSNYQRQYTPTHSVVDEDSSRFFMSEPSYSEDGEASSGQVIRAPHRARPFGRHNSSDEDEQPQRDRRRRDQQYNQSAPSSPGNTSLSSWDSPATTGRAQHMVHIHFAPPALPNVEGSTTSSHRYLPSPTTMNEAGDDKKLPARFLGGAPPMPILPNSNRGEQHSHQNSESDGYFTRELQYVTTTPRTARTQQPKGHFNASSHDRTTEGNTYECKYAIISTNREGSHQRHFSSGADDSIVMSLSDSDLEDDVGNDADNSADVDLLNASLNSSDNDVPIRQIMAKQRSAQRPTKATTCTPHHQRHSLQYQKVAHKRSGDSAAAMLATGGQEWRGMQSAEIPILAHQGDDEDEEVGRHRRDAVVDVSVRRGARVQRTQNKETNGQAVVLNKHQRQHRLKSSMAQIGAPTFIQTKTGLSVIPRRPYGSTLKDKPFQAETISNLGTSWPPNLAPRPVSTWTAPSTTPPMYPYNHRHSTETIEPLHLDNDEPLNSAEASKICKQENSVRETAEDASLLNNTNRTDNANTNWQASRISSFANMGKKSSEKANRALYLPDVSMTEAQGKDYHYYICPRCKTRQREFFTVDNAPHQLEGPTSYLALYFSIYVLSSLFIFGLEEGWESGDCIYFAVVTLTSCGLGDFVPTSAANKIICSIFIYFGVACIGLLLGTYIAGMLDDKVRRDRQKKLMESCPNCTRLQSVKVATERIKQGNETVSMRSSHLGLQRFSSERGLGVKGERMVRSQNHNVPFCGNRSSLPNMGAVELQSPVTNLESSFGDIPHRSAGLKMEDGRADLAESPDSSDSSSSYLVGSPVTRSILDRQSHTRHNSISFDDPPPVETPAARRFSYNNEQTQAISESTPLHPFSRSTSQAAVDSCEDSYSGSDSVSTAEDIADEATIKVKAIKYVFLTLKQALVNSMVIIAVGCLGFCLIEGFSVIDSWYFTTSFLTTVGYGDIVPVTKGGKMFATVYILVGGTVLLNNMSTISIIPIELRKRHIERAVLTQFGDELDDTALRELATGQLIQRLRLSANRPDGLDECTREMFSLAMLVRLGKVTEQDIRETFAAFRRLDVNNEGILNSKSIITAMIQRRLGINASTSMLNLQEAAVPVHAARETSSPPASFLNVPSEGDHPVYWLGTEGSLHVEAPEGEFTFDDAEQVRRNERESFLQDYSQSSRAGVKH